MTDLTLNFGLSFEDLYRRAGLEQLDRIFARFLEEAEPELAEALGRARAAPERLEPKAESDLLLALAPHLEDFLGELFCIRDEMREMSAGHDELAPLYSCRRLFVQRQAVKAYGREAESLDGAALERDLCALMGSALSEIAFAQQVARWEADEAANESSLDLAKRYAAWASLTSAGRAAWPGSVLFKVPKRLDFERLIPLEGEEDDNRICLSRLGPDELRRREGFGLTDDGMSLAQVLGEANYCIWCHNQGKDSCAHGVRDRKSGAIADNVFGVKLTGCPLDEKISEMNLAKSQGLIAASLALIAVDNPLCAATGHRICNDCMKACIYQKQDPVDIPQIETKILKDVLALPWGFEIYSLLTRWNPLDLRRPLPKPESGYKVLVVGLGPAGFNLAHHLLNEGHHVVAVDGLKIEPLGEDLSGVCADGSRRPFRPIKSLANLREDLGERILAGFGGVAEYGITVRWDKNFLKIIRLLLERRSHYAQFGGVRFGGTLTIDDALDLGFDHIALCTGAGKPTFVKMPNALAKGVRMASDFLMALQLTGAAKKESIANLQVRLPIVVIGGGLTAVDAATEALAYYPLQVEKFLARYEILVAEWGETVLRANWSEEERETADEFLVHARAIRAERAAAAAEGREVRLRELLESWGGSTIAYRRRLIDSPSYTGNHEEVAKALEEGLRFAECLAPKTVEIDAHGHARALHVEAMTLDEEGKLLPTGEERRLPARTILVAAGTQPNTVLAREDTANVPALDGKFYQAYQEDGTPVVPERIAKPEQADIHMAFFEDGKAMSFWGDLHPSFAGNVVKAMGGTKLGYPVLCDQMMRHKASLVAGDDLVARLNHILRPRVREVKRLTPEIVEVILHAPQQARRFQPGQFYRLQNFEMLAPFVQGTRLNMEGLALTGAWVDKEKGLISTIVLEMGGSSSLCTLLKPGEPVVLMGPTGAPTEIPKNEKVLLVGGGLGNAVLFSIGQALRAAGSQVLYFAGYKKMADRYHVENIEKAADEIVWCCDIEPGFAPSRPQDKSFVGNIVEALAAFGRGDLGRTDLPLGAVDRMIVIGSDAMMNAVAKARGQKLAAFLKKDHRAIGSINSPMQCMMKEICAQCLQLHRDPETGREEVVFSCFNQDQDLDSVDFSVLRDRLHQNAVQEKLTAFWISRCRKTLDSLGRPGAG